MTLRIGFLGAGLIATFHSKMLRGAGAEIDRAGVFDPDSERAQAFAAASGHHACGSAEEVLDGCDAVYICSWTSEHHRLLAEAARRGVHVFCEKPLATNLAEAELMARIADEAGIVHQVGLILRRSPAYLFARRLVHEPAAGAVMAVTFRDDQYIPIQGQYGSTWRSDSDRAGSGTLLEHSIHDVDMLRHVVGEIDVVSAHQSNFHGHLGIEDAVAASFRFEGGATGTLLSVWHDNLARPSMRHFEVFCERRYVAVDGDDWFGPVRWTDASGEQGSLGGEQLAAQAVDLAEGELNPDLAFVAAIRDSRPAWPDLHTAVAAHRVIDAMYRSAHIAGDAVRVTAG